MPVARGPTRRVISIDAPRHFVHDSAALMNGSWEMESFLDKDGGQNLKSASKEHTVHPFVPVLGPNFICFAFRDVRKKQLVAVHPSVSLYL